MKINFGLTEKERLQKFRDKYSSWHEIFIIWPRNVGHNDWRLLETVERRLNVCGSTGLFDTWEYRAVK